MSKRLKELRALLNLNQKDFAEKIGIKQGSLSDIERGKVGLSNSNIVLICNLFNVNEEWLRDGIGEPFKNKYEHDSSLSDIDKEILNKFNLLSPEDRKVVERIIDGLQKK